MSENYWYMKKKKKIHYMKYIVLKVYIQYYKIDFTKHYFLSVNTNSDMKISLGYLIEFLYLLVFGQK
jgi:hypothetical protein